MDIKPNHPSSGAHRSRPTESAGSSAGATSTVDPMDDAASSDVTVNISSQNIDSAERTMASVGPFDGEKVEALRQAIKDGTYSIDVDAIADKL